MPLGVTFKPLIHFVLIFVSGVVMGPVSFFSHVNIQLSQHYLLKILSFLHRVVLPSLSNIS